MRYTQLLYLLWYLLEVHFQTGLSQNCYSEPNCQGDLVQPGVVVTARDCCVGTDEGMSFSRDNGTTCTLFQCIVHGFNQTSYSVLEGERGFAKFKLNTKGTTSINALTLHGTITAEAVTARLTDFVAFVAMEITDNIQVQTVDDDITLEYDDTIRLRFTLITANSHVPIEAAGEYIRDTANMVIIDNDVLTINFEDSEYTTREGTDNLSVLLKFKRTQIPFTLILRPVSIQEAEDMFNLSNCGPGAIDEDARATPAVDFTSEPFTVTIPASEDNCVITYQLPNNFTIDDNVNEMEQNFALIGELGDDVRDGFAFFQRRIGEEQGCVAGKTGATVIQITDNDPMVIGFAHRRQNVSESDHPPLTVTFTIPINVTSLRASEVEYDVQFHIQTIGQTASVEAKFSADSDALIGHRNTANEPLQLRHSLPIGTRALAIPLTAVIVDDFTPESQECFTVKIVPGIHSNYQCNEDIVNPTDYFCEHTICIDDDDYPFVVAFVETMYTVKENEGQVEVCVNLTHPTKDILDEFVYVDVFNNESSFHIPPNSLLATPDHPISFDTYPMEPRTDFAEQTEDFNAIVNMRIIATRRIICYSQSIYNDMRLELAEYAGLQLMPRIMPSDKNVSSVLTLVELMYDNSAILIMDDDNAIVGLERTFYNVSEDVGVVEVCAIVYSPNITCPIEFAFDVNLSTNDNTAVAPMDYGGLSSILMFAACETQSCVNVTIVDDLVDEPGDLDVFDVTLERTPGLDSRISLDPVDGQIVIIDNDVTVQNTVGYQLTLYTATEGQGQVELCAVIFDPPSGGALRSFELSITTEDGTAAEFVSSTHPVSPDDYRAVSGQLLQFSQGDKSKCHTIIINQDELCENILKNEDFFSSLAPVSDMEPITVIRQQAQVIINENMEPDCNLTIYGLEQPLRVGQSANIMCIANVPVSSIEWRDQSSILTTAKAKDQTVFTIPLVRDDLQGWKLTCRAVAGEKIYNITVEIQVLVPPGSLELDTLVSGDGTVGANLTLTCFVHAIIKGLINVPTARWMELSSQVSSGVDNVTETFHGNMTATVIVTFFPLHTSHAGEYTCQGTVVTAAGVEDVTITSTPHNVTVNLPTPSLDLSVPSGPLYEGTSQTLTCSVTLPDAVDTDVTVDVQWAPVASSDRAVISTVSGMRPPFISTLTFSTLSMSDAGQYSCEATADSSSQYITASSLGQSQVEPLTVSALPAPVVTLSFSGDSTAGQDYSLQCSASVVSGLVVLPDLKLVFPNSTEISVMNSSSLEYTFSPLRTYDGGQYICTATVNISQAGIMDLQSSAVKTVLVANVTPDDSTSASIVGLVAGVGVSIGVILVVIIIIVLIVCWKSRDDLKRKGKCCFTRKIKSDIYCTAEPDVIEMPALENEVSSSLNTVSQSTLMQSTLKQSTLEQQLQQELIDKNMLFSMKEMQLSNVVGQGESGLVYRGYYDGSSGRQLVAVKTCRALSTISEKEKLLKEMTTMLSFTHPNVMSLIGLCFDGEIPLLIMPFMSSGNVLEFVKKNKEKLHLSREAKEVEVENARRICLDICHQISKGMKYLAEEKFVHRDLAARNCMIDGHGVIKVADFGLTEDTYGTNYYRRSKSVTGSEEKVPIKWMAPESIENDVYNESTDVWAFGVTCWEIFTCGRVPYAGIPTITLVGELCTGHRLDRPSNAACSDEIWDIVMSCWCGQSQQRPKFTTLVKELSELLDSDTNYLKLSQV